MSRVGRLHSRSIRASPLIFTESKRRFRAARWGTSRCWTEIPTRRFIAHWRPERPWLPARAVRTEGKPPSYSTRCDVMRFAQPGWLWLDDPRAAALAAGTSKAADCLAQSRRLSAQAAHQLGLAAETANILVRIGDRCARGGARTPADRRRHDQDRRARSRDRRRTGPELEYEYARFPDRPRNQ